MKELLKFSKELKEFRRSGGLPQGDVKNELAKIYEANWKERWGAQEVNRSCPGCIRDMMKILCYEFEGNISSIERDMKARGYSLTRQTLAKYYEQAQKEFNKWIG